MLYPFQATNTRIDRWFLLVDGYPPNHPRSVAREKVAPRDMRCETI